MTSLLSRLPRIPVPQAFLPAHPVLAAEVGEQFVSLVRLDARAGRARPAGFSLSELPDGAVRASALHPNLGDPSALRAAIASAKARVAPGGGPLALCVPDTVARVALLQLESLPSTRAEVDELVSWRLKKQLPYRVDEARVSWQVLGTRAGQTSVLAASIRGRVLAEYEGAWRAAGFEVGSVTTSTLALSAALPPGAGDRLLVHAGDGWFTFLWLDGSEPVMLRTKQLPASGRSGDARDAAIAAELPPTIEYATQRLGRSAGAPLLVQDASGRGAELAERLGAASESPVRRLGVPAAGLPEVAAGRLSAACGLALRGFPPDVTLAQEAA